MKKTKFFALVLAASVVVPLVSSRQAAVESMAMPVCKSSARPGTSSETALPNTDLKPVVAGCALGSRGPGGGVIFYDAGELKWWGRYLEAVALPTNAGMAWSSQANSQTSLYNGDLPITKGVS